VQQGQGLLGWSICPLIGANSLRVIFVNVTDPVGFIAPCLPMKAPQPPSGGCGCTRSSTNGDRVQLYVVVDAL
jgi:hypothetical protein